MRLVQEARQEDAELSLNAAVVRIGGRVGVNADTLRGWCKQADGEPVIDAGDFRVDLAAKKVVRADGDEVHLTPTEWGVLELLVRHRGKLVGQRELLRAVWGPNYGTETNYLRVFMAQIRAKLEPEASRPRYFITEPGMGSRFEP